MISDTNFGSMLGILALSYADPLFDTAHLPLRDRDLFRAHAREAIMEAEDARFLPDLRAWDFDWRGTARRFLTSYAPGASAEDSRRLEWWIRHGFNGLYAPDLTPYFWDSALQWAKHHESWKVGLDPAVADRALELLWHVTRERRASKLMDAIEAIRDHEDENAADEAIKFKTRVDFHADYADPFLLFVNMRGQFELMNAVREQLGDTAVMEALNRIPPAWHAEEANIYADHDFRPLLATSRIEDLARDHAWTN